MDASDRHQKADVVAFGPFKLISSRRRLERDGQPVAIGGRAFDVLVALLERPYEVLSKRELLEKAWPNVHVDESSLRVTVSALRRALGGGQADDNYVTNVPGRGYCFVHPLSDVGDLSAPASPTRPPTFTQSVPALTTRVIGREKAIASIGLQLRELRLVSIVGPGGVGKTTVALSVAHSLPYHFVDEVRFLDLGSYTDVRSVLHDLASAMGVVTVSNDPMPSLVEALSRKRILVVLDGCEHLAGALANFVETVFLDCPGVYLLATSRESLRAEGECVFRLQPLECPPDNPGLRASDILEYPAAKLFVDRLSTRGAPASIEESDAPFIGAICRRLDGIALALELVAGRVDAYGIRGIAELLDGPLALHLSGKRGAISRHRTLSATVDWSYELLSEKERRVLRRLSVFAGPFSVEAARAVAQTFEDASAEDILQTIAALVAKSLLMVAVTGPILRYRLLDTTRLRLRHYLAESGEADVVSRNHAEYYLESLEHLWARTTSALPSPVERDEVSLNIRAAVEFAFSSRGVETDKIRIAAAASRLFLETSQMAECREWAERAVLALNSAPSRPALELWTSLALSRMFMDGCTEAAHSAFLKAIDLAKSTGDLSSQLQLLSGMHLFLSHLGELRNASATAACCSSIAKKMSDLASSSLSTAVLGLAYHIAGDQQQAQRHCESAFEIDPSGARSPRFFVYDHSTLAVAALARVYWLRGDMARAVGVARDAIERARRLDHPISFCMSLIAPISVLLATANLESAADAIDDLRRQSTRISCVPYQAIARGLLGKLLAAQGNLQEAIKHLKESLQELEARHHRAASIVLATDLAQVLVDGEDFDQALMWIDAANRVDHEGGQSWYTPEILRVKGLVLEALGSTEQRVAIRYLSDSIEMSRRQSALSWELRATITMASIQAKREQPFDLGILQRIYDRFSLDYDTPDLNAARRFLSLQARDGTSRAKPRGGAL